MRLSPIKPGSWRVVLLIPLAPLIAMVADGVGGDVGYVLGLVVIFLLFFAIA